MVATAIPYEARALRLLQEGTLALARVEHNGIRIDVEHLDRAIREQGEKIRELEHRIESSEVVKLWKRTFRHRFNLDSNEQLAKILFDDKLMGFEPQAWTKTGKPKTSEKALGLIEHPFVKDYLEIKKRKKGKNTYLAGIRRETVVIRGIGWLRPSFNLHLALTFRSSSSDPNFQNFPVRIKWLMKLIRKCIRARKGRRLIEVDYGGIEVCAATCYHKDPTMVDYLHDPAKDMHRDEAMEIYFLDEGEVTKDTRYVAKNRFVFPEFYGSYYVQVAPDLWNSIKQMDLRTVGGVPLLKHLREQGIEELGACDPRRESVPGTFEHHIRKIEQRFWRERFPVYAQWKRDWVDLYRKRGWIKTKTGFVCRGFMKRNEVINYPVQGVAFHCLLWSLIQIQAELDRRGMKTLIIGQIHDSIVFDAPDSEVEDVLRICREVMVDRLHEEWKWTRVVPFKVEAEMTPVEGDWTTKEKVEIPS